jgi:hypothetical protein
MLSGLVHPIAAVSISDIRSEHVLGAIAVTDHPVAGPKLVKELHYKAARDYRLVYDGRVLRLQAGRWSRYYEDCAEAQPAELYRLALTHQLGRPQQ